MFRWDTNEIVVVVALDEDDDTEEPEDLAA